MNPAFRVVLLGGYGHFGHIIAERVAAIDGAAVIIAGRNLARAEACASRLGVHAAELDLNATAFASRLAALRPNLVISTAGPFQRQDYKVARAAIAARAHYVDIADSRDFVCGVTALDADAKSANVLVVSGASSVPALSAAVVDQLRPRFARVRSIRHGISTSQQVPGSATVASILACCGKPFQVWQNGAWRSTYGWQAPVPYRFALPTGRRWVAPCDIPDLELFPARYDGVDSVQFCAGVESRILQRGMSLVSRAVRCGVIRDAASWSEPLRRIAVAMERFGTGRSAMFVELSGSSSNGAPQTWVWELYAENNDGPKIPAMAAVAIARKLAANEIAAAGATPCIGLLTLGEYLAELDGLAIRTEERSFANDLGKIRRAVEIG
jgi:hypothetical protein